MSKYRLSVTHSSWISINIPVTNRRAEAALGKSVATRVLLLISRFTLSNPLVVRIRLRWLLGKRKLISDLFSKVSYLKFTETMLHYLNALRLQFLR